MEVPLALRPKQVYAMQLFLGSGEITVRVRVVHSEASGSSREEGEGIRLIFLAGLEFIELEDEVQRILEKFIDDIQTKA